MALIDEVRFAVNRTTTATNQALETELSRYINAAVLDLTETTSIKPFSVEGLTDDLLKEAIILYASFMFERDAARKEQYKRLYDDLKTKLLLSGKYSDLGAIT